jgi:DNA-binding NarL/FixJ family response regulator
VITVALIEDHKDIRSGIQTFLNHQDMMRCPYGYDSVEEFMSQIAEDTAPDVILLDIGLPGISGDEGIKMIKEKLPDVAIMMLTVSEDPDKIFNCLCNGAVGYLLKNTPLSSIREHILHLYQGGSPMSPSVARKVIDYFVKKPIRRITHTLTSREIEVVESLVEGLSYKMIADKLSMKIDTVRYHIRNIYKKLQVNSKGEAISRYLKL